MGQLIAVLNYHGKSISTHLSDKYNRVMVAIGKDMHIIDLEDREFVLMRQYENEIRFLVKSHDYAVYTFDIETKKHSYYIIELDGEVIDIIGDRIYALYEDDNEVCIWTRDRVTGEIELFDKITYEGSFGRHLMVINDGFAFTSYNNDTTELHYTDINMKMVFSEAFDIVGVIPTNDDNVINVVSNDVSSYASTVPTTEFTINLYVKKPEEDLAVLSISPRVGRVDNAGSWLKYNKHPYYYCLANGCSFIYASNDTTSDDLLISTILPYETRSEPNETEWIEHRGSNYLN